MSCQDMARMLEEQEVDGLLAIEQPAVQAHLAACRDCARDWQIHARLSAVTIPSVPAELRARYAAPAAGVANAIAQRRSQFIVFGTFVAVAAVAAMLALQAYRPPTLVASAGEPVQVEAVAMPDVPMVPASIGLLPSKAEPVLDDDSKAVDEWMKSVVEWLAARDDADSLLTAAILAFSDSGPPPPEALALLKRAAEMAPDSARIQATAMQLCFASKDCDATPYERSLRNIAPDNALGWELDAVRASRADDHEALRAALASMSRAKTYDLYENAGVAAFISQLREARVPLPRLAGSSAAFSREQFALEAFVSELPKLHNVIQEFCKSATDQHVLAECRLVGAAMRAGDLFMTNLAGISISRYGLSGDSPEARSLAQEERQLRWIAYANQVEIRWIEDANVMTQYPRFVEMLADHPREIDVYRVMLEEHGIPTEPPAHWKCGDCGKSVWE